MAGDKDLFAPLPLRAMRMGLSGLQLSVLTCVCAHDRRSLVTGKGQGCRASNRRMAAMVDCHFSRLCSTLTELVDMGLLKREKLGRHTVYRAIYNDEDKLLFSNLSALSIGCGAANEDPPIGCRPDSTDGAKLPETASQYIPLNGGIDSEESGEEISSEEARFARCSPERTPFEDNVGGQLVTLERALKAGAKVNCSAWYEWIENVIGYEEDNATRGWATRLAEQLVDAMDEDEYRAWGDGHGWVDEEGKWHAPHPRQESAA